jgi:ubiquinone biosynthesis protein
VNWVLTFAATIFIGIMQIDAGAQELNRQPGQDERKHVSLPTPLTHYDTFKRGATGLPLLTGLLKEFEPETQQILLRFAIAAGVQDVKPTSEIAAADLKRLQSMIEAAGIPKQLPFTKEQAVAVIKKTRWAEHRPILIELMVHQSDVLDLIPEKWGAIWGPIIHDALIFFLDRLSDDRLLNKLVSLAMLPPDTSRGDYLKEFVSKLPSLQKLGQIIARNSDLAPEYQKALQDLESGIRTMSGPELSQYIISDIGKEQIDRYQMRFSDQLAGEASVGATILATGIPPGTTERRPMVCKVVKPYVLIDLPEDLAILDGLAEYFTTYHVFYNFGSMPLVEIFREIRKALTNEINVVAEQKNFIRAREYYRGSKKVVVPEIYPISNNHITVMELIKGEKITSAFPDDAGKRSIMARELSDIMTGDVIFSKKPEGIFHGDPHPGNVFHLTSDPANPYKIALIDWGLMGTFPREDRMALMQLIVGVMIRDAKRLHKNVGYLVEGGIPNDADKWQKVDALIAEVLNPKPGAGSFDGLSDLLSGLIGLGYVTKFDLNMFIKSQVTIAGELTELDPALKQDALIEKQVTSMVIRELPKRIPCMIFCWNSRNYKSMLSNGDVVAVKRYKKPKATAAVPAAQPAPATKSQ